MDFYKETKSSSLNYTMLLKYSLTQTDSLAIKSLYIGFLFFAQNRHKLKTKQWQSYKAMRIMVQIKVTLVLKKILVYIEVHEFSERT